MSTIAIIDDSVRTRDYLCTLLKGHNHQVIETKDLLEGLAAVRAAKPDLIITDILLSSMDGYHFVLTLKEDPALKDIPIIFYISAHHKDEADIFGKNIDVKYVLSQASEPHLLIQAINDVLHNDNYNLKSKKSVTVENNLQNNEMMFQQFAENIEEVLFITTPQSDKILYVSPGYKKIWGRSCESLYQNPQSWMDSIVTEDKSTVLKELQQIVSTVQSGMLKYRIVRPDDTIRNILAKLCCVKDKKGEFVNLMGIASDITEYVQEHKGMEIISNIKTILENSLSFREAAPKLTRFLRAMFGWEIAELWLIDFSKNILRNIANSYKNNNQYEDFSSKISPLTFDIDQGFPGKIWNTKTPLWAPDFSENLIYHISKDAKRYDLNQAIGFPLLHQDDIFGVMTFISTQIQKPDLHFMQLLTNIGSQIGEFISRKYTEEQLVLLSRKDILTGLINRATIEEVLEKNISEDPNQSLAVVVIGIDRMNLINQAYGFEVGESLLKNTALRLQESQFETTSIFRAGGAKFGFIISKMRDINSIDGFATKLFHLFETPFEIAEHKLVETISIGISLYPQDAKTSKVLIKYAGMASRFAHEAGGNQVRFFNKEISSTSSKKLILENDLRKAIENNEFTIHYQPKVNIKSKKVTGVKALLRWDHPEQGIMNSADFMPIAEETGLIIQLGDLVMQEACRTLHALSPTNPDITLSFNISNRQLCEQNFIKKLQNVVESSNISPHSLELEITENFIMSNLIQFKEAICIIKETLGVRVTLDEFGSGYSSLSYLTNAQIDCIKIDKSFIEGIPDVTNNLVLIKAIIALAKVLAIKSVADGVETQEQWDFLAEAGCDEAQGYFCCHPMPKEQLFNYLQGDFNIYLAKKN